jgi:hypothetical protein
LKLCLLTLKLSVSVSYQPENYNLLQFHETLHPWLSWFVFTPLGFRYIMFNGRTNGLMVQAFVEMLLNKERYQ